MSYHIMEDNILNSNCNQGMWGIDSGLDPADDDGVVDVDVELLAEAFFDDDLIAGGDDDDDNNNNNDKIDRVAQQIRNEEKDAAGLYEPTPVNHQDWVLHQQQHQVVSPPASSPPRWQQRLLQQAAPASSVTPTPMSESVLSPSATMPFMNHLAPSAGASGAGASLTSMMMAAAAAAAAAGAVPTGNGANTNTAAMMNSQQRAFIVAPPTNPDQETSVTLIPNPFLALAAATMDQDAAAEFMQAAMNSRQRGRRTRQMTEEQAERRRERNRQLAKKTRDRKKDYMSDLQQEVMELQRANAELKAMVRLEMDEVVGQKVLQGCDAIDKVPETVWEACGTDKHTLAQDDFDLVSSIQKSQTAFVITDPSFEDNPIVFVSPDFLKMTGYCREQVVGRNCRFLQGTQTSPQKVQQIRKALAAGEDVGVTIVNYKADGTPFWNRLFIAAVRDVNGAIVNYMGVAVQVARPEPGDPEHDVVLRLED